MYEKRDDEKQEEVAVNEELIQDIEQTMSAVVSRVLLLEMRCKMPVIQTEADQRVTHLVVPGKCNSQSLKRLIGMRFLDKKNAARVALLRGCLGGKFRRFQSLKVLEDKKWSRGPWKWVSQVHLGHSSGPLPPSVFYFGWEGNSA